MIPGHRCFTPTAKPILPCGSARWTAVRKSWCCAASHIVPFRGAIYYMRAESSTENSIRRFNLATREDSRISTITKLAHLGLSISPDGRYLIYSQIDEQGADLMIVDNFR